MLGSKKVVSLWRRRRPNFLALERAMTAIADIVRHSDFEHAVVTQKAALRRIETARRRDLRRPGSFP